MAVYEKKWLKVKEIKETEQFIKHICVLGKNIVIAACFIAFKSQIKSQYVLKSCLKAAKRKCSSFWIIKSNEMKL